MILAFKHFSSGTVGAVEIDSYIVNKLSIGDQEIGYTTVQDRERVFKLSEFEWLEVLFDNGIVFHAIIERPKMKKPVEVPVDDV